MKKHKGLIALIVFAVLILPIFLATVIPVINTVETVHADSNYEYNKTLYQPTNYIYNQNDYYFWKFGLTSFDGVGCEVVSVYNIMLMIDRPRPLAEIIYDFEKNGSEMFLGFGGSNPLRLGRYFDGQEIRYAKYFSMKSLQDAANAYDDCNIIISYWNNNPPWNGLHTIAVKKTDELYCAYNKYSVILTGSSLKDFSTDYFIIGYIIGG
ncbi:MAG: hypothetical protein LBT30_00935 [Clostridiales bacterium]|jgi:hypothetical protein|nr:hypothetical protein [Clostridiales bacterium]